MIDLNVRIVRLEPFRAAKALGFGGSPEVLAWEKLMSWAQAQGLLEDLSARRFFGFNNPNPAPGSPNYGYEQWITLPQAPEAGSQPDRAPGIEMVDFPGGLYAVARCQGVEAIFPTWQALVSWVEDSPYKMGERECLEECLTPRILLPDSGEPDFSQMVFDLYEPLDES